MRFPLRAEEKHVATGTFDISGKFQLLRRVVRVRHASKEIAISARTAILPTMSIIRTETVSAPLGILETRIGNKFAAHADLRIMRSDRRHRQ